MKSELESLFPDDISDEAASVLSDVLWQLISAWDSRYFIQLQRYQASKAPPCDPEQPWRKLPDR